MVIQPAWQDDQATATLQLDIELPGQVVLDIGGKTDQDIDIHDGRIHRDTYVKILAVNLSGWRLNDVFLHQKLCMQTATGDRIISAYLGHCGTVTLDFGKTSVMSQVIECNRSAAG